MLCASSKELYNFFWKVSIKKIVASCVLFLISKKRCQTTKFPIKLRCKYDLENFKCSNYIFIIT